MALGQAHFRLSDFKQQVLGKGLARTNRFEVIITSPKKITRTPQIAFRGAIVGGERTGFSTIPSNKISLLCEQASFPLLNINTKPYRIYGPAYPRPVVSEYGGDGTAMTFHVDREMQVKQFFDGWMQIVIDKDNYHVSFQEDYVVDIEVFQLDEAMNRTYGIRLIDSFPRSMNLMELNHAAQSQTHRLIVLFAYRKWESIQGVPGGFGRTSYNDPELTQPRINNQILSNGSERYFNSFPRDGANPFEEGSFDPRRFENPVFSNL